MWLNSLHGWDFPSKSNLTSVLGDEFDTVEPDSPIPDNLEPDRSEPDTEPPGFLTQRRALIVVALLYAMALGPVHFSRRRIDYARVPQGSGETWLAFDPFFHLMTNTKPACGIIDPFNVYGEWSFPAISPAPVWSAYRVSSRDVIDCLERNPEIQIALGFWGVWFVDDALRSYLDQLPAERFVFEPRYLDGSGRNRKFPG